ncbi:lysozyme [Lactiplantibacillus fabifermentans T30PCM01]|uniref:Lysozyme n=1 Tax=Lactiplantibacillus fabifermentans T30PCM01 TaxID=1400520 RepID=W6T8S5_9LACO|nr:GH25 family lysozyme [Lactiplantibacillus fabifermentans]ETY74846.1 lysozyme [Lactiplantibacillus fabifermentans T30PCM01]
MTKQRHLKPVYAHTRGARWRRRGWWLLVLLLIVGLGWGGGQWLHYQREAVVKGFNVRGVAVTQNDGYLDFAALQSDGLKFVYLKATQGASYTDDDFSSNYQRIVGTNLGVGVTHVFSFSSSAAAQAAYFEKTVNDNIGNLPIAIQVQYYGNYTAKTVNVKKAQAKLRALVLKLTEHYGRECVIWSNTAVEKQLVKPAIKKSPLWLDTTSTHHRSSRVLFMHYSDRAVYRQNGTSQEFSGVVFNGSASDFQSLIDQSLNATN